MEILLYCGDSGIERRMRNTIAAAGMDGTITFYPSLGKLMNGLQQPTMKPRITLIAVSSRRELDDLEEYQHIIGDMRTILILPDRTKATVTQALRLYPRFITYPDGDFRDLEAILHKMRNNVSRTRDSHPSLHIKDKKSTIRNL